MGMTRRAVIAGIGALAASPAVAKALAPAGLACNGLNQAKFKI